MMKKILVGLFFVCSLCLQAQNEKKETISKDDKQNHQIKDNKRLAIKKASTLRGYTLFEHKENWNTIEDIFDDLAVKAGIRLNALQPFSQINTLANRNITVVVDGVQYDLSILNTLNPKDIEKIEVLRGAISNNQAILSN